MSDIPYYLTPPPQPAYNGPLAAPDSSFSMRDYQAGQSSVMQPDSGWAESLSGFGMFASMAGTALAAVGSYYAAKSQKYQMESQAMSAQHAQSIANINARAAEDDARAIIEAGQREKVALTLQQGQDRAAVQVGQAASGTAAGSGSNAEVLASQRLAQQIDAMTLDRNTVRAAEAARTRAVNERNEGLMAGVSAQNIRASARSINPGLASATSLLGSAGTLASQWVYRERRSSREY